jgi:hypothetical protein
MLIGTDRVRVDKTYEVFSIRLSALWSAQSQALGALKEQTGLIRSKTEDRIRFTEGQPTWAGQSSAGSMSHQLNDKIREVLAKMTTLQSELGHLEIGVALLQRQLESSKAGEETIH